MGAAAGGPNRTGEKGRELVDTDGSVWLSGVGVGRAWVEVEDGMGDTW